MATNGHISSNGTTHQITNATSETPLIGVAAALEDISNPSPAPQPKIFGEFSLEKRVGLVTGANGGLGLEMALALAEAGATVYCLDLPATPSNEFEVSAKYAKRFGKRMHYIQADVTDQMKMQAIAENIANDEGSLDVCVAAAGILDQAHSCVDLPIERFQRVMNVNTNGVFITAAAAAQQMTRLQIPGSIILIASMSGSITNRDHDWVAYNTSKSAVLQLARSMACELGHRGIRVNSVSPGHIRTSMTNAFLKTDPKLEGKWANMNPLGRLGKVHEVRGVTVWLASDASTFCTGSDILVTGGHHAW